MSDDKIATALNMRPLEDAKDEPEVSEEEKQEI